MNQLHSTQLTLSGYSNRLYHALPLRLRNVLRPFLHTKTLSELLLQVEQASTPTQLTRLVNKIQVRLFKLPAQKQTFQRKRLIDALTTHVLRAPHAPLRIAAAEWLRMFVQSGQLLQPEEVFVTLVTATERFSTEPNEVALPELLAYLQTIFDCFWPFRFPYPAYSWQQFPANEIFYPLTSLLSCNERSLQDLLISIFNELPALDDEEIAKHLLPVALAWSRDANAERRCRIANILAHLNQDGAQEALLRLQSDANSLVAISAKRAAATMQPA